MRIARICPQRHALCKTGQLQHTTTNKQASDRCTFVRNSQRKHFKFLFDTIALTALLPLGDPTDNHCAHADAVQ